MSGHLTVIIGSMFSGKSTEIIRLINRFKVLNKTIVAINHSLDDRYDGDNAKIITHDKVKMDCLKLEKLLPFSETEKYKSGTVLDPFGGSGTTGLVANNLGRNAILIELNEEYVEIAKKRLGEDLGLFSEVEDG